jgi:hypothetical protein
LTSKPKDPSPLANPAAIGASLDGDPRWGLVQRVASSATFQKTWRLRELLLFLGERVLRQPGVPLREQEISVAVFGRGNDFDPTVDPLVRVQASQLRKRLLIYFTSEGAAEPTVIEIPKGAYTPIFRERGTTPLPEVEAEEAALETGPVPSPVWAKAVSALAVLLLLLSSWLYVENRALQRGRRAMAAERPTVERFWGDIFANERPTHLVLGDASLSVFLDATHRMMSATEYQREQLREGPHAVPNDPGVELARQFMQRPLTSTVDAKLAHRVGLLAGARGAATEVVLAREANAGRFRSNNIVLVGPRRGNPWIELFEERLAFPTAYDPAAASNAAYFKNRAPATGEPAEFRTTSDEMGFCRVAYLPNLDATGRAVLITGSDIRSTEAGVELLTDERWAAGLAERLHVGSGGAFPSFELVLRVRLVLGEPLSFETAALRIEPADKAR